jgi:hypothetical protein
LDSWFIEPGKLVRAFFFCPHDYRNEFRINVTL